ncbi:MAG: SH3 domain-containing protein [Chloroflexi bacterium]|nr:SH3 domain-containing protein [Chloroflexota bacterium]
MRVRAGLALLIVALFASACTLRRPDVTLTLAPIETNTPAATDVTEAPTAAGTFTITPTPTATPTATATETATVAASDTDQLTNTNTLTATLTATQTPLIADAARASATEPPTATNTATPIAQPRPLPPTETALPTETLIQTETPSPPQRAEEAAPTATSEVDVILQRAFEPTFTALPTVDDTEVARLLATPPPRPTLPATWTAAPTVQLPDAAPGPATQTTPVDSPTPDVAAELNPTPSDATPPAEVGIRQQTPTASPTRFQPTVAVQPDLVQPTIALVSFASTFNFNSAPAYQYNVGPSQLFNFQNVQLGDGVRLFLPNPVDSDSWIRTDHYGVLRYKPLGALHEGVMSASPFFEGFGVPSIEENKNRVLELDWSADGQQFSFRVAPPSGADTANAGVWFWQPRNETQYDPTYPIIRDCPNEGYHSCSLVHASNARLWQTRAVAWSPIPGSNTLLLTVELPDERRNALAIAQAIREQSPHQASRAPHFIRYDYGHWNLNGQGIIVSGRRPDGRVIIGEVQDDLTGERVILDGTARGLWLRDAARRPNGAIVALGRPGAPGSGPVALYDQSGTQISGFIGHAPPEDVRWLPDRSMVVVSVQGRQYAVQVDGGRVTDATGQLSDPQFSAGGFASSAIPSGVIEGAEYRPGEQLRLARNMNVRQNPSTNSPVIGGLETGDYVAILAGPHRESRYEWWRVQTANFVVGWIAAKIDGNPTVREF